MQRRKRPNGQWVRGIRGPAAAIATMLGLLAGASAQDAQDYRPQATIVEIMNSMVAPFTQTIWDAVVYDDPISGPDTEEGWQAVRSAAIALAESANALAIPGRPVAGPDKVVPDGELSPREIQELIEQHRDDWVEHAHVLHEVAMLAIQAIDARNAEQLADVGGKLNDACEGCHAQFWYPNR